MFFSANTLLPVTSASAQGVLTLGEINSSGSVYIKASNDKWASASATYPLIQNTAIMTEDGMASLFFTEGSRVDLAKKTIAVIDGAPSEYSIKVAEGMIAFNIAPASSLLIQTSSAKVRVGGGKEIVKKVAYENNGRILGIVSVSEQGTEVKCISGSMSVNISGYKIQRISTGEKIFVSGDNKHEVLKTQAIEGETIEKGDTVKVKTEGLEGTYRVNNDGDIVLPDGTRFHLEGLTEAEAAELIAEGLNKNLAATMVEILDDTELAALAPPPSGPGGSLLIPGLIIGTVLIAGVTVISTQADGPFDNRGFGEPSIPTPYTFSVFP
jgi:hypothetical protein